MSDDDGREDFGLLMPFVAASDNGGPFEVNAFTAGWEMGALWVRVAVAIASQCTPLRATIRRDNYDQADLIAMHYGLFLSEDEWTGLDDDELKAEWAHVTLGTTPPQTER